MSSSRSWPREIEDDYEVIRISLSWGTLSILGFVTILVIQLFGSRVFDLRISQVFGSTLILAVIGFSSGLIGLRYGGAPQASRFGAFLNGVVLFCIFVLLPVAFVIIRWLR